MSYVLGNIVKQSLLSLSLTPAAVDASTWIEQTFTVNGLQVGDHVSIDKPSVLTGLSIVGQRVSAANTLAITFLNVTASPITPGTGTYLVLLTRPDRTITDGNI